MFKILNFALRKNQTAQNCYSRKLRSNSSQMWTFNFWHFLCDKFLTYFRDAGI